MFHDSKKVKLQEKLKKLNIDERGEFMRGELCEFKKRFWRLLLIIDLLIWKSLKKQ